MSIFSRAGLPIFAAFYIWNVGTGAIVLARPLFAAELGANVFLATLVIASNNFANLLGGPITGYLTDRWGRRPLLIAGALIRGASGFLQFLAPGYVEFLALEFLGGLGVSMFMVGSTVLIADMTVEENRGRALAARLAAMRLGQVTGPAVGAVIAAAFDLRSVFLVNGVSKFVVLGMLLWMIAETRPTEAAAGERHVRGGLNPAELAVLFRTRAFALIALVAFSLSMMGPGVFSTQFPLALQASGRFEAKDIGFLLSVASLSTLLVSVPNGFAVDRWGRKRTLVPGLALLSFATFFFATSYEHGPALLIVIVYGAAEGMCMGAAQAYAMDMAPVDRRGAFLGGWAFWQSLGGTVAPLIVALAADQLGFATAFSIVAVYLLIICGVMWALGPDTRRRAGVLEQSAATRPSPS